VGHADPLVRLARRQRIASTVVARASSNHFVLFINDTDVVRSAYAVGGGSVDDADPFVIVAGSQVSTLAIIAPTSSPALVLYIDFTA
jgi:hypothetical protein